MRVFHTTVNTLILLAKRRLGFLGMTETPARFSEEYFTGNYRSYVRQNPIKKMEFYRRLLKDRHLHGLSSPSVLDLGCAFGRFLGSMPGTWRRFGLDISEFAVRQAAGSHASVRFAVPARARSR